MDWFCSRCHTEEISHMIRARLLVIFWTLILTMMLYPIMSMVAVQVYTALSGNYIAGHHSVLLINCPTEQTAIDIGRNIMEKRMAACVNILPRTSTMFYWKGEIQDSSEILLLVRTRTSMIRQLTEFVKAIHPYYIPEILSFPIQDGSHAYLKWIDDAVPDLTALLVTVSSDCMAKVGA